jgi:hypothetical protein
MAAYRELRLRLNLGYPHDRWLSEAVDRVAARHGIPASSVLRRALRAYLPEPRSLARGEPDRPASAHAKRRGGPRRPTGSREAGPAAVADDRPAVSVDSGRGPAGGSGPEDSPRDMFDRLASMGVPPDISSGGG